MHCYQKGKMQLLSLVLPPLPPLALLIASMLQYPISGGEPLSYEELCRCHDLTDLADRYAQLFDSSN